jgi:hypothetical protein
MKLCALGGVLGEKVLNNVCVCVCVSSVCVG